LSELCDDSNDEVPLLCLFGLVLTGGGGGDEVLSSLSGLCKGLGGERAGDGDLVLDRDGDLIGLGETDGGLALLLVEGGGWGFRLIGDTFGESLTVGELAITVGGATILVGEEGGGGG
jgi:hypothetical protein